MNNLTTAWLNLAISLQNILCFKTTDKHNIFLMQHSFDNFRLWHNVIEQLSYVLWSYLPSIAMC